MNVSERPEAISSWIWYDKQRHADLEHWQNCLFAAYHAGAKDLVKAATDIYVRQGGKLKPLKPPRSKKKKPIAIR